MQELKEQLKETVKYIKREVKFAPTIGVILGTGLGGLAEQIEDKHEIPYSRIPHFPLSTVATHKGQLVWGVLSGKKIVAMEGRFHYYEGYTLEQVTYPVRVMRKLGADILIISNAAGGMNPLFSLGDLMIITDHINLMGINPLIGPNDESLGSRFPDMSEAYNRKLIKLAEEVALSEKIKVQKGVYVGVTGPNLETAAEYRFLRAMGADAVGMSTVPEVIVAVHCGFKILAMSCITDRCLPDALRPADINKIIKVANEAEPKLTKLVSKVIEKSQ